MVSIRLFVKTPEGERVYDFEKDEIVAGRDPTADIELDDRKLSRKHCRFYQAVDGWRVCDLESRNGTTLNGTPVLDDRISDGDRVEIGQAICTVSFPRSMTAGPCRPALHRSARCVGAHDGGRGGIDSPILAGRRPRYRAIVGRSDRP